MTVAPDQPAKHYPRVAPGVRLGRTSFQGGEARLRPGGMRFSALAVEVVHHREHRHLPLIGLPGAGVGAH